MSQSKSAIHLGPLTGCVDMNIKHAESQAIADETIEFLKNPKNKIEYVKRGVSGLSAQDDTRRTLTRMERMRESKRRQKESLAKPELPGT